MQIREFNIDALCGIKGINEKLEERGVDADSVISIETIDGRYRVWYKVCVKED